MKTDLFWGGNLEYSMDGFSCGTQSSAMGSGCGGTWCRLWPGRAAVRWKPSGRWGLHKPWWPITWTERRWGGPKGERWPTVLFKGSGRCPLYVFGNESWWMIAKDIEIYITLIRGLAVIQSYTNHSLIHHRFSILYVHTFFFAKHPLISPPFKKQQTVSS